MYNGSILWLSVVGKCCASLGEAVSVHSVNTSVVPERITKSLTSELKIFTFAFLKPTGFELTPNTTRPGHRDAPTLSMLPLQIRDLYDISLSQYWLS